MLDMLRRAEARRLLWTVTLLVAVVLAFAHFGLAFWTENVQTELPKALLATGAQITGGILAGVATTGFLLFISKWLLKKEDEIDSVRSLTQRETRDAHIHELSATDFWYHNGHIGRWVRTEVMPAFRESARHSLARKTIELILLDPSKDSTIRRFAEYRMVSDGLDLTIDEFVDDTKIQIYATIARAAALQQNIPSVVVSVYLRDNLDYFRVDINKNCAFNTIARPHKGAVAYYNTDEDSDMYDVSLACHDQAKLEANEVDLNTGTLPLKPNLEQFRDFFDTGDLPALSDELFAKAFAEFHSARNPYSA